MTETSGWELLQDIKALAKLIEDVGNANLRSVDRAYILETILFMAHKKAKMILKEGK